MSERPLNFVDEVYSYVGNVSQDDYVQRQDYDDPAQVDRVQRTIDLIPDDVESLLDVGAGFGVLLHEVSKRREIQLEGIELCESRMTWGHRRGLSIKPGSANALPYEDRSFDILTACEVIEHLPWQVYEESLVEMQRVAKNWLLISVPYDERLNYARCPYCGSGINPNYHLRSFAPTDFDGLFEDFALETLGTIGTLSCLTMFKPLLPANWHPQMVCPTCNYRSNSEAEVKRSARASKAKSFLRGLPFPKRPRWLIGLFRRVSD